MTGFEFLSVACPGATVTEETTATFAAVEQHLRSRGLGLADVLRTRLLYTARADYPEMGQVREPLFRDVFSDGGYPAAAGFATGGRGGASPRFELEIVAARPKTVRNSPQVIRAFAGVEPPFSHATAADGVIFVSGQTAFELDGSFPDRTPGEQARKVLGTLAPIVAEFGATVGDVIALTVFVDAGVDDAAFADIQQAIVAFTDSAGAHPPVVTCVDVTELVFPGAQVGMEAVAVMPGTDVLRSSGRCRLAAVDSFFAASASSPAGASAGSAFDAAARELGLAIQETGIEPAAGALVTVWYTGDARAAAQASARRVLASQLPDAQLTLVPLQPRTGAPAVIFEIYGACVARHNQEAL
jgi:2-iminobutanoate/2-iminopropanoate deaminase